MPAKPGGREGGRSEISYNNFVNTVVSFEGTYSETESHSSKELPLKILVYTKFFTDGIPFPRWLPLSLRLPSLLLTPPTLLHLPTSTNHHAHHRPLPLAIVMFAVHGLHSQSKVSQLDASTFQLASQQQVLGLKGWGEKWGRGGVAKIANQHLLKLIETFNTSITKNNKQPSPYQPLKEEGEGAGTLGYVLLRALAQISQAAVY